jgi:hypothetical protein
VYERHFSLKPSGLVLNLFSLQIVKGWLEMKWQGNPVLKLTQCLRFYQLRWAKLAWMGRAVQTCFFKSLTSYT